MDVFMRPEKSVAYILTGKVAESLQKYND